MEKEDIENIGFVFLRNEGNKLLFLNESKYNRDEKLYFGEKIENTTYIVIENNCGQFYFMGWIETIEDLKKILKQVGVYHN